MSDTFVHNTYLHNIYFIFVTRFIALELFFLLEFLRAGLNDHKNDYKVLISSIVF